MNDSEQHHLDAQIPAGNPASIVIRAVIATKIAIGTLTKDANNPFHRYKYVPIDAYYEHVASKAAECGLSWRTNLSDLTVFSEGVDDRGRPTSILRFTFTIDLMHESGVTYDGWQTLVILHPVQGAQTTGSALSYAEKLFMRTTFSVTTAEDDVDGKDSSFQPQAAPAGPPRRPGPPVMGGSPPPAAAAPQEAPKPRGRPPRMAAETLAAVSPAPTPVQPPPPAPVPLAEPHEIDPPEDEAVEAVEDDMPGEHDLAPGLSDVAVELVKEMDKFTRTPILMTDDTLNGKWDIVGTIMKEFIGFCTTDEVLNQFWRNNIVAMKMLEKADLKEYMKVVDVFKARRSAIAAAA